MTPDSIAVKALDLLHHFGFDDWRILLVPTFSDYPDKAGCVMEKQKTIHFATDWLDDDREARLLILHEVAHVLTLAEKESHGPFFTAALAALESCPNVQRVYDSRPEQD